MPAMQGSHAVTVHGWHMWQRMWVWSQMLCALELLQARPRARLSLAQLRKIEAA